MIKKTNNLLFNIKKKKKKKKKKKNIWFEIYQLIKNKE